MRRHDHGGHRDRRARAGGQGRRDPEPLARRRPDRGRGPRPTPGILRRPRTGRGRHELARHPGHGVSDRVGHQDLHRDRGAAAVGAGAGRHRAPAADPHRRGPGGRAPLRPAQDARPGRDRAAGTAGAVPGRVLPRRPPRRRRAGHQVRLHQPRVRHPRPARRGRDRHAPGPLPTRAHLQAAWHGRHHGPPPGTWPGS